MQEVRARATIRPKLMSVLSFLLVIAGLFGLAVIGALLFGHSRSGLDYYCLVTMLPIPPGLTLMPHPLGASPGFPSGLPANTRKLLGTGGPRASQGGT